MRTTLTSLPLCVLAALALCAGIIYAPHSTQAVDGYTSKYGHVDPIVPDIWMMDGDVYGLENADIEVSGDIEAVSQQTSEYLSHLQTICR